MIKMIKNKDRVAKKLVKSLNSSPFARNAKKVNNFTFLGMIIGLAIGIIIDIYFLNIVFVPRIPNFLFLLNHYNFTNYPRSIFFNVAVIPLFGMLVGTLMGKGIELLLKQTKKR